jgi:hypothetical protein
METKACSQKGCSKKVSENSSMNCNVCSLLLKAKRKRSLANQKLLQHINSSRVFSGALKLFS